MNTGGEWQYKTAEDLRKAAQAYFDYCDRTPRRSSQRVEITEVEGQPVKKTTYLNDLRPYTFAGLEKHLKIANYNNFEKDNAARGADFAEVLNDIRKTIETDQVEGGLNGQYAHNIVCRLNGIAENMNVQNAPAPNIVDIFAKD